jgi:7-carboxy-7-deazaguanine synthase
MTGKRLTARVGTYPVADIFHSLQGEGHFVGYPMTFVRLAGCSVVDCHIRPECDEAPWKMRERLALSEIVERVRALASSGIVCITGGEPTDHDILPLIAALRDAGYRMHLETSGVRSTAGYPLEWLTVSPKLLDGRFVQRMGHTLKIVVRPEWGDQAWNIVKGADAGTEFFHRYLQPMTVNGEPVNLPQVTAMLLNQDGPVGSNCGARWALSVQAHRAWGLK